MIPSFESSTLGIGLSVKLYSKKRGVPVLKYSPLTNTGWKSLISDTLSEIFKIFLFESGFLGFVAGCIGVGVGWFGANIGADILDNLGYGFLSPHYSWTLFLGCIAFATLTGAIWVRSQTSNL